MNKNIFFKYQNHLFFFFELLVVDDVSDVVGVEIVLIVAGVFGVTGVDNRFGVFDDSSRNISV